MALAALLGSPKERERTVIRDYLTVQNISIFWDWFGLGVGLATGW